MIWLDSWKTKFHIISTYHSIDLWIYNSKINSNRSKFNSIRSTGSRWFNFLVKNDKMPPYIGTRPGYGIVFHWRSGLWKNKSLEDSYWLSDRKWTRSCKKELIQRLQTIQDANLHFPRHTFLNWLESLYLLWSGHLFVTNKAMVRLKVEKQGTPSRYNKERKGGEATRIFEKHWTL